LKRSAAAGRKLQSLRFMRRMAILLSTFDPKPLETPAEIAAYFHKLTQNPNLEGDRYQTREDPHLADGGSDSGLYTFSYTKDGRRCGCQPLRLRVSTATPAGWLVVSHPLSVVPIQPARGGAVKHEVEAGWHPHPSVLGVVKV